MCKQWEVEKFAIEQKNWFSLHNMKKSIIMNRLRRFPAFQLCKKLKDPLLLACEALYDANMEKKGFCESFHEKLFI